MREYETTVIVQPEISSEGTQAIMSKMDALLESHGSTRLMCSDLGKRKLAYEVRKFPKGHSYVLSFLDDGQVVVELERALRIEESVLRFMTVKVEDEVVDVETRVEQARIAEVEQEKRAAEKAAREAEEAKARAEVEAQAAEEARSEAAKQKAKARAAEEAPAAEEDLPEAEDFGDKAAPDAAPDEAPVSDAGEDEDSAKSGDDDEKEKS